MYYNQNVVLQNPKSIIHILNNSFILDVQSKDVMDNRSIIIQNLAALLAAISLYFKCEGTSKMINIVSLFTMPLQ